MAEPLIGAEQQHAAATELDIVQPHLLFAGELQTA
jgi:hypothetical protein